MVSIDYIRKENLEKLKAAFSDAFIEDVANGTYFSTTHLFNPKEISLEVSKGSFELSKRVARMIGGRSY